MSDIPSDIVETAKEMVGEPFGDVTANMLLLIQRHVEQAIYEERKRCARIADDEADMLLRNYEGYPAARVHDFLVVARRISKAILSGETKD